MNAKCPISLVALRSRWLIPLTKLSPSERRQRWRDWLNYEAGHLLYDVRGSLGFTYLAARCELSVNRDSVAYKRRWARSRAAQMLWSVTP